MQTGLTSVVTNVVLPHAAERCDILIRDGRFEQIRPIGIPVSAEAIRIDGRGLIAVAGFIDLHVHGAKGHDFMDASDEAFAAIGAWHAAGGTTAYLPTTATESPAAICACIDAAARARDQRIGGVEILGVHVEGPYMAPAKHGCHDPGHVRQPSPAENRALLDRGAIIRRITLAPEIPGVIDFIRDTTRAGIVASGGHSEATIDQTLRAMEAGMSMITHLYCAMSTITKNGPFRVPGMLEAALLDDRLGTELIADCKHVSPDLMRLAMKAKTEQSVCFVTDAMRGAGMPDGDYTFGSRNGTKVVVENGVARNQANTGFASSVVRMIDVVRNAVDVLGMPLADAVKRASLVPALLMGISERKGSITPGKDADLVLLEASPRLEVRLTMNRGQVIFNRH